MTVKLRPYQRQAIDAVKRDWQDGYTDVLLTMSTGGGKTIVFLQLLDEVLGDGKRALILSHRRELVYQPYERMGQFWPHRQQQTGIVMGQTNAPWAQIVIATVQSLQGEKRLAQILRNGPIDYLVTDECHHAPSDGFRSVINVNPALRHLGVTATPLRADGKGLRAVYQKEAAHFGIKELVKMGYLAPPRWLAIQTGISLADIRSHGSGADRDFNQRQLANVYETANCFDLVVASHRKYAADRQSVAFTVSVDGAYELADTFNRAGIAAVAADGNTNPDERRKMLADFRKGDYQVLVNCLDADTEILTKRGWIGMNDICEDDVTAAVDLDGGMIVHWEPITRIIQRKRNPGERMVRVRNMGIDIRVTEGHRMAFRTRGAKRWKLEESTALPKHISPYQLPVSAFAKPEKVTMPSPPKMFTRVGRRSSMRYYLRQRGIPEEQLEERLDEVAKRRSTLRYKHPSELSLDECKFIGLFIADGCMVKGGRGIEISQSQRNAKSIIEIEQILKGCGFDYKLNFRDGDRGNVVSPYIQNLYRIPMGVWGGELKRSGYFALTPYLDKDFCTLLFGLNRKQTIALMRGIWLGDGCKPNRPSAGKSAWQISNTNRVMLERLQILCTLRGLQADLTNGRDNGPMATRKIYQLFVRDRQFLTTNNHTIPTSGGNPASFETDWRDEEVWCVTNQTGTIITRRNGDVTIMGQCALFTEGLDLPEISCVHQVRPTRSDGMYAQMVGRALRLLPGKKDALILDYCPLDTRNLAMLGDVLGVEAKKEAYIADKEDAGEVVGGLTFDGDVKWLEGNPMEIVSRSLDYLNVTPWRWSQPQGKVGPMVLGLGPGTDDVDRTLVISSPAEQMDVWLVAKREGERWHRAYHIMSGTFEACSEWANEYASERGNAVLARKQAQWRDSEPTDGQVKYARRLGVYQDGMTKGEVADAITCKLALGALNRMGVAA